MKDTYYKQTFVCLDCQHKDQHMIWKSSLDSIQNKCSQCEGISIPFFEERVDTPLIITRKMTKSEIKSDRYKRSREHFKREVLPTIDPKSVEGRHFHKKYKTKK